jgi:hypothetical protein
LGTDVSGTGTPAATPCPASGGAEKAMRTQAVAADDNCANHCDCLLQAIGGYTPRRQPGLRKGRSERREGDLSDNEGDAGEHANNDRSDWARPL